mmetsp:Transcript_69232/g.129233  ORF Transcript_69232/g.129233 Transcript_69232/m.129233 type:complete len:471 (+) Transcript_69232:102-1514(+)
MLSNVINGGASKVVRVRAGDRVRAHFRNVYGDKSAGTDIGTLLQFTTAEAEVHFDDGAVQCVPKTWVTECLTLWDLDLQVGNLVTSHYASGKGRTSGTDLGIVLLSLDGGRIRVRFQDDVVQTIPCGWVEEVIRLRPGDRVMSYFKVNDGRGAKSLKTDVGTVLSVSMEEVQLVFDDSVEQKVPKIWVVQCVQPWDLGVEIGNMADVHFEVGDDGRRSIGTDACIVVGNEPEGRISVQFADGVRQTVPLGWVVRVRDWGVGDRVQSHFKTGGGEKSNGTDLATVLTVSMLETELYFDDGIIQYVSKAWVTDKVTTWVEKVPDLAIGDVVVAHFKRPGNQCRSVQTDRGIIMSMMPRGQVSIKFQDGVTQVIPKGWIEGIGIRWSGHRERLSSDEAPLSREIVAKSPPQMGPIGQAECVVCMDAKPNAVIVHGETCHQSTCFTCAKKLQRKGDTCPICRETIDAVCKIHGD